MKNSFPHINSNDFPYADNIDVYKYQNEFDYNRWPENTRIRIINVPWRADYDNVVKFENDYIRENWFEKRQKYEFTLTTMYHVAPNGTIKLPVPASVIQKFNYLQIKLPRATSDLNPIMYENGDRREYYYYFIEDVEQTSPSTSLCTLQLDMWTTYINDVNFKYVMLDRGHAPMSKINAEQFLKNPKNNNKYLLTPDVNFGGEPSIAKIQTAKVFNDSDLLAIFVTQADITATNWGNIDYPQAPAKAWSATQGVEGQTAFSIDIKDLGTFLTNIDNQIPQFKATILACFFVPSRYIAKLHNFTFVDVKCSIVFTNTFKDNIYTLNINDFQYNDNIKNYAKLYTYPYAIIEIAYDDGERKLVKIEEIDGNNLRVFTALSLVLPWIKIDSVVLGIGGIDKNLDFYNLERGIYSWGGQWIKMLHEWSIPLMSVYQAGDIDAKWKTAYQRRQRALAASNELQSSLASNATAQTNANNNAKNIDSNIDLNIAATIPTYNTDVFRTNQGMVITNKLAADLMNQDVNTSTAAYKAELAGLAVSTANNAVSLEATALGAAAGLAMGGPVGGLLVSSLVGGPCKWATQQNSIAISQSNSKDIYNATVIAAANKTDFSNNANINVKNTQFSYKTDMMEINNKLAKNIANNNSNLIRTNAQNTRNTSDANANRTYSTKIAAIQADLDQSSAVKPIQCTTASNMDHYATRPQAIFCSVFTQTDSAINSTGDQFARYGYVLQQQWNIEKMQMMKYFTYWKCSEVWLDGNNTAIERAQEKIKDIMENGVTVWENPDMIGKVSIYDNY